MSDISYEQLRQALAILENDSYHQEEDFYLPALRDGYAHKCELRRIKRHMFKIITKNGRLIKRLRVKR